MPNKISHSLLEVEVDDQWRRIDAYINHAPFWAGAVAELKRSGWRNGFSVALPPTGQVPTQLDLRRRRALPMVPQPTPAARTAEANRFLAAPRALDAKNPGRDPHHTGSAKSAEAQSSR